MEEGTQGRKAGRIKRKEGRKSKEGEGRKEGKGGTYHQAPTLPRQVQTLLPLRAARQWGPIDIDIRH